MNDSILNSLFLNEDNAFENLWILYIIYAILTGLYSFYYNPFTAFLYAGITLEINLRVFEYTTGTTLRQIFRRRHPTMVAF